MKKEEKILKLIKRSREYLELAEELLTVATTEELSTAINNPNDYEITYGEVKYWLRPNMARVSDALKVGNIRIRRIK